MAGIREMLNRGNWPTKPPIGYDIVRTNGLRLIEINAQGRLIGRAFIKKLKENLAWNELSLWLKSKGLNISSKRLSEMSRNVFYCGYMAHKALTGEVVKGNHQGVITKQEFLALNQLLESKFPERTKVNKKNVPEIPLKGHLICSDCNSVMTGYQVKSKGIWYYKCNTNGCKHNVSASQLHKEYESLLGSLQIDKKFIEPIKEQYKRTLDTAKTQALADQNMKIQKIKDIQRKLDTVDERFALGIIDQQIHQKSTYKFKLELEPLSKEIGASFFDVSNPSIYAEKAIDNLCNLLTLWDKLDVLGKKRIVKSIFPAGISVDKVKSIYRTQNLNVFIDYIQEITRDTTQIKKRNKEVNFTYSALVAPSGIEPACKTQSGRPESIC